MRLNSVSITPQVKVDFQVEASDVGKHIIATGLHYIKLALEALVLLLLLSRSVFDSHPT